VYPRWLVAGELGVGQGQKQVTIRHHDVDVHDPVVSSLILRAWFLHRCLRNNWCSKKSSRRLWRVREIDDIRLSMVGLDTGSLAYELIVHSVPDLRV
jgi:hypothetical protein